MKPLMIWRSIVHLSMHETRYVAPGAAEHQAQAEAEGAEEMRNTKQEDFSSNSQPLSYTYGDKWSWSSWELSTFTGRRQLLQWRKENPSSLIESFSVVLKERDMSSLIHRDTVKLLWLFRQVEPEDVTLLLTIVTALTSREQCTLHYISLPPSLLHRTSSTPSEQSFPICNCWSLMRYLWKDPTCCSRSTRSTSVSSSSKVNTTFGDISILALPTTISNTAACVCSGWWCLCSTSQVWLPLVG